MIFLVGTKIEFLKIQKNKRGNEGKALRSLLMNNRSL